MQATLINVLAIMVGSILGLLFKKKIPQHLSSTLLSVVSLVVIVIGISGAMESEYVIFMIVSLAIGTLLGESLALEDRLEKLAKKVEDRFSKDESEQGWFVKGFISATLLFGIGAMAIVGSFEAGLHQNFEILYTKSMLDFIAAALLSASLGVGVFFSAFSILLYQGTLTLLASSLSSILTNQAIALMSATGSILIMALGLNMLNVTKLKVTNMILSLLVAIIIGMFL